MTNTDQQRAIEFYLTDLDDYLLAYGLNPRTRLEHIEQTADALLTSGADPMDEFGPPADYAEQLTSELGITQSSPWRRILAVAGGHLLLQEGFLVALLGIASLRAADGSDLAYYWNPGTLVSPLFLGVAAWAMLSRHGVRWLAATTNRWPTAAKLATVPVLIVVTFAAFAVMLGRGAVEIPLTLTTTILALITACAGIILVWRTGFWQLIWATLTSRTRPGSNMSYRPLGTPKVRIQDV